MTQWFSAIDAYRRGDTSAVSAAVSSAGTAVTDFPSLAGRVAADLGGSNESAVDRVADAADSYTQDALSGSSGPVAGDSTSPDSGSDGLPAWVTTAGSSPTSSDGDDDGLGIPSWLLPAVVVIAFLAALGSVVDWSVSTGGGSS